MSAPSRPVRPFYVHRMYVDRARVVKAVWWTRKYVWQRLHPPDRHRVLLILGSQRSGTTMLSELFDADIRTRVYGEFSRLSAHDPAGIRLNELTSVRRELRRWQPHLSVLKPLVESQRAAELLDGLPGSAAVWAYRDHRDVVSSRAVKFGADSGRRNLDAIRAGDRASWRADRTQGELQELVRALDDRGMTEADELAAFWYIRNAHYFAQGLQDDSRVVLVRYADLVTRPADVLQHLYAHVDLPWRDLDALADVRTTSIGKGSGVALSTHVEELCRGMLDRLDAVYRSQPLGRALA